MGAVEVDLDTRVLLRQRTLTGTYGGSILPRRDIPMFVDLFLAGKLDLRGILDARYRLEDLGQAFDDLHHGRVTRGVVVFGGGA
jgi:alcohol dehydrogenase